MVSGSIRRMSVSARDSSSCTPSTGCTRLAAPVGPSTWIPPAGRCRWPGGSQAPPGAHRSTGCTQGCSQSVFEPVNKKIIYYCFFPSNFIFSLIAVGFVEGEVVLGDFIWLDKF